MYAICSIDGYYTGETYIIQGEKYAVFNKNINKAKKYKSLKRVEKSCILLEEKCTNCCKYYGGIYAEEVIENGRNSYYDI